MFVIMFICNLDYQIMILSILIIRFLIESRINLEIDVCWLAWEFIFGDVKIL